MESNINTVFEISKPTKRSTSKKITTSFVILCSLLFFVLLRLLVLLSNHSNSHVLPIDSPQCLSITSKNSTPNDLILLAVADEGRVDLTSCIVPISLMRKYTQATIVLFVEHKLYRMHNDFFFSVKRKFNVTIKSFEKPNVFIANYRIKLYYEYLKDHKFDRVIHCDISDVYFQTDIFKYIPQNNKIIIFKEGCEGNILMDDQKNLNWYRECYPDLKGLDKTKVIVNAGIISGGYDVMLKYTKLVWKLMEENTVCDISKFGPDQAVVEYAYHNGMLDSLIGRVENGPVYCNYARGDGEFVYYKNGCLYPFIHGRPPYYPEEYVKKGLSEYPDLVDLA